MTEMEKKEYKKKLLKESNWDKLRNMKSTEFYDKINENFTAN